MTNYSTGNKWLLVFDNVDDIEVIKPVWPGSACGSVLITTRDQNVVHKLGTSALFLQPFDNDTAASVLLELVGLDNGTDSKIDTTKEIAHALGGLPLALDQIAGFIRQRKIRLQDFLPLYERNASKINARKTGFSDYPHTLETVWEMTLATLSGPASRLLRLLSFFVPDNVEENVILEGSKLLSDEDMEFLEDEME